jgi:hypothetical protein
MAHTDPTRRQLLLAGAASLALAACGGGGDAAADSPITEFSADNTRYLVGQRATLTARFRAGTARIEPGIGAVENGERVSTPPLDGPRRYRLIVTVPGQPDAVRELALEVGWRDRWLSVPMPFGVAQHATAALADGSLLVLGGSRAEGVLSDAIDRYDPATRAFTRIGHLSTGRGEHHAVRLADGRVLVVGGQIALSMRAFSDLVDPQTGQARPAGEHAQPRVRHATTRLADGRVFVSGGVARDSAEIWDPATERWRLVGARMAHERQHHTHTLLPDGRLLIVGGFADSASYVFAEIFDPQHETFGPLADARDPALQRRYFHAAHALADGSVLVVGGSYQGLDLLPQASVLRVDPVLGRIAAAPQLATPRTLVKSLLLPGDQVLMAGGQTGDELASDQAAVYHPGSQRNAAALPGARAWHSVDALPDGRVIVIGGEAADGTLHRNACIYD